MILQILQAKTKQDQALIKNKKMIKLLLLTLLSSSCAVSIAQEETHDQYLSAAYGFSALATGASSRINKYRSEVNMLNAALTVSENEGRFILSPRQNFQGQYQFAPESQIPASKVNNVIKDARKYNNVTIHYILTAEISQEKYLKSLDLEISKLEIIQTHNNAQLKRN